jgi:tRNA-splicing ligase RtcB (3'-phosphate/5'-hydroxy nucleic acid ligase)
MKSRELTNLGIPKGPVMKLAQRIIAQAAKDGMHKQQLRQIVGDVAGDPENHTDDAVWGDLASALIESAAAQATFEPRSEPAPWRQWGRDLEETAIQQLEAASRLSVSVCGALMPDAHVGYGLPIGGVLATDNAVIPFAVGMDIACRMKMSVFDLPVSAIGGQTDRLKNALHRETCFGVGGGFRTKHRRQHDVMDDDWSISPVTRQNKDKAWRQLGSSGSGNHFAEFGVLTLDSDELGLEAGEHLALLTHSGSRGVGGSIAQHYSKLAMELHPELPRELSSLAWLDLDSEPGQEYWSAMELMGRYAAANHQLIHRYVTRNIGAKVLADIENHHNFAWKETHAGRDVIVHRKGATPAEVGMLGLIPGSMATPCYVVRGKGCPESLNSASHGAGRRMSRKKAKETFTWSDINRFLKQRGVELISAGLDEAPMAYKDIEEVMRAQKDLVEPIARFDPKLVKMAPGGQRPED